MIQINPHMIKMRLALSRLRDVFVDLLHHLDDHGDDDENIGDEDGVPTSLSNLFRKLQLQY